jgi:DNA-binding response OmpR family regulator
LSTTVNEADQSAANTPKGTRVLILEPDEKLGADIVSALSEAAPGAKSAVARSVAEAQQLVIEQKPELFVLDVDAIADRAQEFIYDLRTSHPDARAIVLTASHFTAQRDPVAGLGAMHFLEKPFPRNDFIVLAEALLAPAGSAEGERFQGTLSDLHIADIIQLKCISGVTSMLEFTSPGGEKARVYFENGQVRHATAPGLEGRAAFDEIVDWKGGLISEVPVPENPPRTIDLDWQVLLMEAVRKIDETRETKPAKAPGAFAKRRILVIDDSVMLLSFVKEILTEEHCHVATAATAEEGLRVCRTDSPDLVLLDYVLPDMKGDEVCRKLLSDPATSKVSVLYMSGFGTDLQPDANDIPNVIGALSKPFTSESLIAAVEKHLPSSKRATPETKTITPTITPPPEPTEEKKAAAAVAAPATPALPVSLGEKKEEKKDGPPARVESKPKAEPFVPPIISTSGPIKAVEKPSPKPSEPVKAKPFSLPTTVSVKPPTPAPTSLSPAPPVSRPAPIPGPTKKAEPTERTALPDSSHAYFCGDSSFFSLHWALQTIAREKLTGMLRAFWSHPSVDLLARDGRVIVVTARDPNLYCSEAPITLLNVDQERIEAARAEQTQNGCPLFLTLAKDGLILREPGLQLVHHYGQKLFAQLWAAERVRFVFEQQDLPGYANDLPQIEDNVDQWALSTLRFVQYQELGRRASVEPTCVPAYTRDGYERVQQLRLTDAEAQFASQFNGSRSIAQISKNLRLDIKFARLSLFRFLALEIVECWPAQLAPKPESRGGLRGIFGRR